MVISPEVQDDAVPQVMERVTRTIGDLGGAVENQDVWGRRRLAYPIKRFLEGNYVLTHFQMEPGAAANLDASLRINEDIIRHLLVRRDE